jgi:hypothetical protein
VTERAPIAHAISRSLAHLSGGSAAEAARNLRSQRRLTTASAVQPRAACRLDMKKRRYGRRIVGASTSFAAKRSGRAPVPATADGQPQPPATRREGLVADVRRLAQPACPAADHLDVPSPVRHTPQA